MVTVVREGEAAPADAAHPAADELAALAAQAHEIDGAAGPDAAGPAAAPAADNVAELRSALRLVRVVAAPLFAGWPAYGRDVWSDQQLNDIATHGGALLDQLGWSLGDLLQRWGPAIGLIVTVVPPSIATWQYLQLRKVQAAQRAREAAQRRESGTEPIAPAG